MSILAQIPTLFFLFIGYNALVFLTPGDFQQLSVTLAEPLIGPITMMSGAKFAVTWADTFIALGVVLLYIEIFKSTRSSASSMIELSFSLIVFIAFLVEFLLFEKAGTSTFMILTLMQLIDVMSGFTVMVSTARRDFTIDH
ncbi:MAG: hypothetical protein AAF512_21275 [Pseudomonadota bacterium]